MIGATDLSIGSLIAAFALLIIPIAFSLTLKLGIVRESLIASARMAIQLFLAGLYLTWLFKVNNPALNIFWILVMMLVASLTTVQKSDLRPRYLLGPVCIATFVATIGVVLYFNGFIARVDRLFDARYLVVIGGMVLGNSLHGNIVSLTHFYSVLRAREERFLYFLGNGATLQEAVRPFYRESMIRALKPTLASMATIGLVALPGMMTGQMLGGSPPLVAIKYQIAIMLTIFSSVTVSTALAIYFSSRSAFSRYGILRPEIFRD